MDAYTGDFQVDATDYVTDLTTDQLAVIGSWHQFYHNHKVLNIAG